MENSDIEMRIKTMEQFFKSALKDVKAKDLDMSAQHMKWAKEQFELLVYAIEVETKNHI